MKMICGWIHAGNTCYRESCHHRLPHSPRNGCKTKCIADEIPKELQDKYCCIEDDSMAITDENEILKATALDIMRMNDSHLEIGCFNFKCYGINCDNCQFSDAYDGLLSNMNNDECVNWAKYYLASLESSEIMSKKMPTLKMSAAWRLNEL